MERQVSDRRKGGRLVRQTLRHRAPGAGPSAKTAVTALILLACAVAAASYFCTPSFEAFQIVALLAGVMAFTIGVQLLGMNAMAGGGMGRRRS